MNLTAAIGWSLLFLVLAISAFVWDRDLSVREQLRLKKESKKDAPSRPRKTVTWIVVLGALPVLVVVFLFLIASQISLMFAVSSVLALSLLIVIGCGVYWGIRDRLRHDDWVETFRFKQFRLKYLFIGLLVIAVIVNVVRIPLTQDTTSLYWYAVGGAMLIIALLGTVAYIGMENLFFGRGSGKRLNRLRELEEKRKEDSSLR
ncbi:hypothetical protein ACYFX5_07705 [Bremerella sp. T1]|uniref:hypothetical protein n=1 Tax=Bremerella sp. TYQ1 TaxID=3119568 RepID=UPI001CCB8486|nr:hypothetical protein [Bremerella volcania]UBM38141.1 hypothetical protein LA756_09640 [Bremerella volcania]